jgi:hypothetical protein
LPLRESVRLTNLSLIPTETGEQANVSDFLGRELLHPTTDGLPRLRLELLGWPGPVVRGFDAQSISTKVSELPWKLPRGDVVSDSLGQYIASIPAVFNPPEVAPEAAGVAWSKPSPTLPGLIDVEVEVVPQVVV